MTAEPEPRPEPSRENEDLRRNGPLRESDEGRACDAGGCWWNLGAKKWDSHKPGCPFNPRQEQVRKAPKSRRKGRITDHESARREIEQMVEAARGVSLPPCPAHCYEKMAATGWRFGSVFVAAGADWLAEGSDYSDDQCLRARAVLEDLGYIERVPWRCKRCKSRPGRRCTRCVRGGDPGLWRWGLDEFGGQRRKWPYVYILRQDLPENEDVIPNEDNPIIGALTAAV